MLGHSENMTGFGRPSRRRGFTWLELGLGAGALGLVALGASFVLSPGADVKQADLALRDAQRIRDAALEWREKNPTGCPTVTQLKHEHSLAAGAATDDPWGSRYRLSCSKQGVIVMSAGRDGKADTDDDVRVPKTSG